MVCVRVLECELNMHICDMRRVITHIAVLGEQVYGTSTALLQIMRQFDAKP